LFCFHILMIVISFYSLDYFAKILKFQSVWIIFIFGVFSHLEFFSDIKDTIITFGGLYYFLPLAINTCNEKWFLTMPLYLVVQIYPCFNLFTHY